MSKVVLISGANRGIGLKIAQALSAAGYCLSLGMRSTKDFDPQLAGLNIKSTLVCQYDALNHESANKWVEETIATYDKIDGLINCAGVFLDCGMENFEETNLDTMWNINTKGPVILTKAVWSYLKQSGEGRIINIASLSAKTTNSTDFGYSLSKHALLAFTHSVRKAGWEYGIRSTAICPGWVNTSMAESCPFPRDEITQPEDIAKLLLTILALPNTASIAELTVTAGCL